MLNRLTLRALLLSTTILIPFAVLAQSAPDPLSACNPATLCDPDKICDTAVLCDGAEPANPEDWTGNLAFGFNFTDGNTDTSLLNFGALAQREINDNIWRFSASHSVGENDNETNIDQTTGLAEYKRLLSERAYLGFSGDFRRDEIAAVDYRVVLSPAFGYFLIKDEDIKFNIEVGPGYVFEEVGGVSNDYLAPRIGQRLEYQISETAKFFEQAFVLLDAEDSDNYIVTAEAGLETNIVGSWSLILSARDVYDNVPAEGLVRNDLTFLTSISYSY